MREGRRKEFHDAYAAHGAEVPDPLSERTFADAHIDWDEVNQPAQARRRDLVRRLLSCRAQFVTPHLADPAGRAVDAFAEGDVLRASWRLGSGTLHLFANLSDSEAHAEKAAGKAIWFEAPNDAVLGDVLPPWSVCWTWEA